MFNFGKGPGDSSESIFNGTGILEAKLGGNHVLKGKLVRLL